MANVKISQESTGGTDQTRVVRIIIAVVALVVAFIIGRASAPDGGTSVDSVTSTTLSASQETLNKGLALHGEGKLVEAEAEYMKVLDLEPTNQFALYNIGVIAQSNNMYDKAIEYYTKALASNANFTSALYNRGLAYRDAGNKPNAIADLEAVIKIEPTNAAAFFNAGNLYNESGDAAKGALYLAKAKSLDPQLGK